MTIEITLRTLPRSEDVTSVVRMHREIYSVERGFDETFARYVEEPLREFASRNNKRERLWMAEREGELLGCIAIVESSLHAAQLRWYVVHPQARGCGLGRRLLREAVVFAWDSGYVEIFLWTESVLVVAARLYREFGFELTEERSSRLWGQEILEQKYELRLQNSSEDE